MNSSSAYRHDAVNRNGCVRPISADCTGAVRRIGMALAWLFLGFVTPSVATEPTAADLDFYEQHIRPLFAEACYECHSGRAASLKAGLRLDVASGWARGGVSGVAIDRAEPSRSLLLRALQHDAELSPMPPDRRLDDQVIARVQEWIERGAPGPASDEASRDDHGTQRKSHWAFTPPVTPPLPTLPPSVVADEVRAIDRLLTFHHRSANVIPAPLATTEQWMRRVAYDLTGLPPTYGEIQRLTTSTDRRAEEAWVEQMLASPRFGERWARIWMDVSRYADTKGYVFQEDRHYPEAYRYRDWLIRALNEDRPYNDFVRYQLAADQLAADRTDELAAMGFLTLGRRFLNNRHDIIDDRIDVVTRGLMGLTVTCARCHDHKFDPIPIADYYSLYGVFASSEEPGNAPSALRMVDRAEPVMPVVFLRGNPARSGPSVPRQFLEVLAGHERKAFVHGSGRLELADAIVHPDNPLTARVFVNRVWGQLMGAYIVDTPSDFGVRSEQPPLADVLDRLSVEFMRHHWSVKWLVRELVTSAAYRRSSFVNDSARLMDPENRWFSHALHRRKDFEGLRDAMLAVSQQLDAVQIGGPSVDIAKVDARRRTVYAFIDRQNVPGLFRVFDVASSDTHAPKRYQTTVPQQALFLLNHPFAWDVSGALANRMEQASEDNFERIRWLYRQVLSRDPTEWELEHGVKFTTDVSTGIVRDDAYRELAQVLLLTNEFLFLD